MGGTIIETESEKLVRQGRAQMIIELGQEDGLEDAVIIERPQKKSRVVFRKSKIVSGSVQEAVCVSQSCPQHIFVV